MDKESRILEEYIFGLKHVNRFCINDEIKEIFDNVVLRFKDVIKKGKYLYRGRLWDENQREPFCLLNLGPPPVENTINGRVNPKGISYLYTAEDKDTVIAELRPNLQSKIDIGTFNIIEDISVLRLDKLFSITDYNGDFNYATFFIRFSCYFCRPCLDSNFDYLPMQYFSEFCKSKGIESIKYPSSVRPTNSRSYNVTLFKNEKVECINSETYSIEEINYKYKSELYNFPK